MTPVFAFEDFGRQYRIVRTTDIHWLRGHVSRQWKRQFPYVLLDDRSFVINGVTDANLAHYRATKPEVPAC